MLLLQYFQRFTTWVAWKSGIGGSLVNVKMNRRGAESWCLKSSVARAGLLAVLAACASLSACTSAGSPLEPLSPTPSTPSVATSAPGTGVPTASNPPTATGSEAPATSKPNPTATVDPSPASATPGGPDDVPSDDTDYSKDVGNTPRQYEYESEPPPPDSVVATLCNLNQVFFKGLRKTESGRAVADSTLRTNMVGLEDLMDYWETLRVRYPGAGPEIDTGLEIHQQWANALLAQDNEDSLGAQKAMDAGEELIKKLPESPAADCLR